MDSVIKLSNNRGLGFKQVGSKLQPSTALFRLCCNLTVNICKVWLCVQNSISFNTEKGV